MLNSPLHSFPVLTYYSVQIRNSCNRLHFSAWIFQIEVWSEDMLRVGWHEWQEKFTKPPETLLQKVWLFGQRWGPFLLWSFLSSLLFILTVGMNSHSSSQLRWRQKPDPVQLCQIFNGAREIKLTWIRPVAWQDWNGGCECEWVPRVVTAVSFKAEHLCWVCWCK